MGQGRLDQEIIWLVLSHNRGSEYRYVSQSWTPLNRNTKYTGQFSGGRSLLLVRIVLLLYGIHDTPGTLSYSRPVRFNETPLYIISINMIYVSRGFICVLWCGSADEHRPFCETRFQGIWSHMAIVHCVMRLKCSLSLRSVNWGSSMQSSTLLHSMASFMRNVGALL